MANRASGALEIGDQWNAINIIARSQTHPLKAVCELVENAIDAGGQHIHIVRRKAKEGSFLELHDDGDGVVLNEDGEPDFAHIATHVCDSMKRQLQGDARSGIHGEFGIGLLSFWSIGDVLKMASANRDGVTYEMALTRSDPNYRITRLRGELPMGGTRIQVGPLLEATRNVLTGEKIQRYLASELRDRIRKSGVEIKVSDRVARKEWVVTPREYDGERLDEIEDLETEYGPIHVELYLAAETGVTGGVSVCKDGTRVIANIADIEQFQQKPWTDNTIEGLIDFPALNLAPGTRGGIVPDEIMQKFVESVQAIEEGVLAAVSKRQKAHSEKASREILKQVKRAFTNALRELPREDYVFFDLPRGTTGSGRGFSTAPHGAGFGATAAKNTAEKNIPVLPIPAGPLATVRISPHALRREPEQPGTLIAKPRDEHGFLVTENVEYDWEILNGKGTLTPNGAKATICCDEYGLTLIQVTATQGAVQVTDIAEVRCVKDATGADFARGLPEYRLLPEPQSHVRSRYDVANNEIVVNSAHRDFVAAQSSSAKYRKYIGKLYAKEVVLTNFPHENSAQVMERLVEVLLRTEDGL